ncbi:MAG TPA: MotA/TolQ/ExbB proton channel family protein [Alphaproteobacteria bacterium]|nr:MotA/TolQ/ExbB proton channel family protein [Alphaproteobacteria bacterium]
MSIDTTVPKPAAQTRGAARSSAAPANRVGRARPRTTRVAQTGSARLRIDAGTLLGLAMGSTLIVSAIMAGGSLVAFFNFPALLIVLGGTLAVVIVSYSLPETLRAFAAMPRAAIRTSRDPGAAAAEILRLADTARRFNLIGLEESLPRLAEEVFLHRAISMACEGTPGDVIEQILRRELDATRRRHQRSIAVLRRAAEVAPAMGLIGTLIGLVQMLGRLQDPHAIGPAMAIALLGTLYGAMLAHLVFNPLATKLERNSGEESLVKTIYVLGAGSIGRHEPPRRLERTINALLPPSKRLRFFD